MISLLVLWAVYAVALYVTANVVPGLSIRPGTNGVIDAFVGSLILAVVNKVIKPIILILTFPITLLTLGLFYFVIIGITFWLMTLLVPGIKCQSFFSAILGSLLFGFLGWILHFFFR
jgi:putative membrane protein